MKKKLWLLFFLTASVFLLAGKVLFVRVMRSNLMAKPDFLSASLAAVEKGAKLAAGQKRRRRAGLCPSIGGGREQGEFERHHARKKRGQR
jgi:hypothetical protein